MTASEGLRGAGVVVTRAEPPGGPLEERLTRAGARVLRWCAVGIEPPSDPERLADALRQLGSYRWMVLASARAVESVVSMLAANRGFLPASLRIAVVGPGTAAAARHAGWSVAHVGGSFSAEGLIDSLRATGEVAGARVLLPGSQLTRPELREGLARLGAIVDTVEAYRTVSRGVDNVLCRVQLAAGEVDAVTFASPSAVAGLWQAFGAAMFRTALRGPIVASIGPTTTASLVEHGRAPDAEAVESTFDGLVAALAGAIGSRAMNSRKSPGA